MPHILHLITSAMLIGATVGMTAGCASSSDEGQVLDDVTIGEDSQDLGTRAEGTYSVPVRDPSLREAATFPVSVKTQALSAGVRVHYTMPVGLVGKPDQSVSLEGPETGTKLTLVAAEGQAVCTQTAEALQCNEKLPGIVVDLDAVRAAAIAEGLSPEMVKKRVAVGEAFSVDPIGILKMTRRTTGGRNDGGGRNGRNR
jgi:hypothetical protein